MGINKQIAILLYILTGVAWFLFMVFFFKLMGSFKYPDEQKIVEALIFWRNICFSCAIVCTIVSVVICKLINEVNSEFSEYRQRISRLEKIIANEK